MTERDYTRGSNAAWRQVLSMAMRNLDSQVNKKARWLDERAGLVAALRIACDDFGDNEWDDNLDLRDVLDKHLVRHLHERQP